MMEYLFFIIGIILLIKGADYLIDGSSSLAKKFKISTLAIGLTVVAFGTSLPELVVNMISAINGSGDIAFGNIIGSNISNILLILGVTVLFNNIKVQHSTIWKEIPFSLLAIIILFIFTNTLFLDDVSLTSIYRFEGLILLAFFVIFLIYVVGLAKSNKNRVLDNKIEIKKLSNFKIGLFIIGGLFALFIGGKWTVEGAVAIAKLFGLSEYFIGLTVVAVGTSLPELFTSIMAARKGEADLAIGNVVGSNIFNIFFVLGVTSIIFPIVIPQFANIDVVVLILTTCLLFAVMFIGRKYELERWQGVIFILLYLLYAYHLIIRG